MPTLIQFSVFFSFIGTGLALAFSWLILRKRPVAYFRWWTIGYAWGLMIIVGDLFVESFGPSLPTLLGQSLPVIPALWFHYRVAYALADRPFPKFAMAGVLAIIELVSLSAFTITGNYHTTLAPGVLLLSGAFFAIGWQMIRVGRRTANRGMAWMGAPMIARALIAFTYPVLQGGPYLWLGFALFTFAELAQAMGMIIFVLYGVVEDLERQNLALGESGRALQAARAERERETVEQLERLRELDQMKTGFLNTVSHELRTPLASIAGYAEFLADGVGGPLCDEQQDFVAQIEEGARRLRHIVDDLLDYARVEAGTFALERQTVDLRGLLEAEAASLAPLALAKQIATVLQLPETPLDVCCDPRRIGQVLANLLGNAIKFTPAGGRVEVAVGRSDDALKVSVRDNGPGIEAAMLGRVFDKFFQVQTGMTREHGGAGLGLAIAKAMVEAHGGTMGVDSVPGAGSTFWFTLPTPTAGRPAAATKAALSPPVT